MLRTSAFGLGIALAIAACKDPSPQAGGLSVHPKVVDFGEVVVGLLARRTLIVENRTPEIVRVVEVRPDDPIAGAVRIDRAPAALVAGSTAEIEVVFAPDREGTFSGPIHIATDGDPPELSVEMSGVALAPFLRAVPEEIDFGRVRVFESAVWTATITNGGNSVVTVSSLVAQTTNQEEDEFSVGPYAIERLEPGESFTVDIIFTPRAGGSAAGRIVVGDDSPRPSPLTISVKGEGVDSDVRFEPMNLDFTGVLVGEARIREFDIRNVGTTTHSIDAIEVMQPAPPVFSIATASIAVPFLLGPGQERRIAVRFAPNDVFPHEGSVAIDSSAGAGSVLLFGAAFQPPISGVAVAPRTIDFGGVQIGSSGARELAIESVGYINVHFLDPIEIDPPDAPFTMVRAPLAGTTLGAFDSHTMEIRYAPEDAASHAAVLRIRTDAANQPIVEVPLSGRGENTASSDADPRPTSLVFGNVPRGIDALRTIVLFNGGTAPLVVSSVEITEDAGGRFTLEQTPGSSPIAPGESHSIRIRYSDPLGLAASQTGTVAITTDDPDRPLIRVPLYAATVPRVPDEDVSILIQSTALDLHLLSEGSIFFDRPYDCCWCNPSPAWGDPIASPFLDDDRSGPQTIRLARASGVYEVEVHSREAIPVTAEVTITLRGAAPIVRTREVGPGQRWRVGTIRFFSSESGTFSTASFPLDTPMADACY